MFSTEKPEGTVSKPQLNSDFEKVVYKNMTKKEKEDQTGKKVCWIIIGMGVLVVGGISTMEFLEGKKKRDEIKRKKDEKKEKEDKLRKEMNEKKPLTFQSLTSVVEQAKLDEEKKKEEAKI